MSIGVRRGGEQLAMLRRRASAIEQMCGVLAKEVASLAAEVTELIERPSTAPLSVSVDEAARVLGLGRSTMFALLESGEVRSVKVGARRLVPWRALEELLDQYGERQAG
jgi:excisionase family DNA binding protein